MTTSRNVHACGWRIIGFLVLLAVLYAMANVYFMNLADHRERELVQSLEAIGGRGTYHYFGPKWLPKWMAGWQLWYRVEYVDLAGTSTGADKLSDLRSLRWLRDLDLSETNLTDADLQSLANMPHLESLILNRTRIGDVGLQHLRGLNLEVLGLFHTRVTDAGLKHLAGMDRLSTLHLHKTQTSVAGRSKLRMALPNCKVDPEP